MLPILLVKHMDVRGVIVLQDVHEFVVLDATTPYCRPSFRKDFLMQRSDSLVIRGQLSTTR